MTRKNAVLMIQAVQRFIEKSDMSENTNIILLNEAFNVAIEALETQSQRWIPVKKKLPKKSGKYYVSGGGKAWICEFLIIPNFGGGWCNDASNPVVQAWMPEPEPFKEDEE